MVGSKVVEERFGAFHWWKKMATSADQTVHRLITMVTKKYQLYKKIAFLFLFEFLPAYAYRKTIELKDYVYKKYYTSQINLKGNKKMLRSNGSVSEFLQNISKDDIQSETHIQ